MGWPRWRASKAASIVKGAGPARPGRPPIVQAMSVRRRTWRRGAAGRISSKAQVGLLR
jgi:hypothetical protein